MKRRIRQFFRAIFARVGPADRHYVRTWLPESELQQLFWEMAEPDQFHALHTAYTAEQILNDTADAAKTRVDRRLLIRAALLHDIGRARGTLGTLGKTAAVLLDYFFPQWARRRGDHPPEGGILSAKLYVYFHHPVLGAEKLRRVGYAREAAIILRHHALPAESDPVELILLRRADALN